MWWKATTSTRSPWVCGSTEFFPPAPEIIPPKWAHQRLEPKWPEAKAWWPTSTFTALSLQHFMLFHNTVPTQIPWRNVPYVSQHLSRGTTCFPFFLNALVCVLCILERYYCTPPPPHPTPPHPAYPSMRHWHICENVWAACQIQHVSTHVWFPSRGLVFGHILDKERVCAKFHSSSLLPCTGGLHPRTSCGRWFGKRPTSTNSIWLSSD